MTGQTGVFKPGVAFKSGKMYIFTKRDVTVIRPWPPAAWRKTKTKPWKRCRPRADILLSDLRGKQEALLEALSEEATGQAGDSFQEQLCFPWYELPYSLKWLQYYRQLTGQHQDCFADVPMRVIDDVRRFEERRFALLSFAHACGEPGLELLESNPALGFMVATNWIWHKPSVKRPMDAARRLVRMRRRDALSWLQFSTPAEAAVRVLGKYPAELLTVKSLFFLRDALRKPEVLRQLSHLGEINPGVIRFVSDDYLWPHTTPALLRELATKDADEMASETAYYLGENLRMMERLERGTQHVRFASVRRIYEVHQELSRDSQRLLTADLEFPPPPLSGSAGIEPIETPEQLILEAREQQNCAMSLAPDIASGLLFLYRVTFPERATLSIAKRAGEWAIEECRGPKNAPVGKACIEAVHEWLAKTGGRSSTCLNPF